MILTEAPDLPEFAAHHAGAHVVIGDPAAPAARCSLWWEGDIPSLPGERLGVVGHYAARSADAGRAALAEACAHLARERGCTLAAGPMDGNTWRRYRLATGGLPDEPPFFLEPANPPDYPDHWIGAGFAPLAQYLSTLDADLSRTDERAARVASRLESQGVTLRPLDLARAEDDLRAIYRLSLVGFARAFLYTPLAEEDFLAQYRRILPAVRPELIVLAHDEDGDLAGFLFAIPDLNEAQRGETPRTAIVKTAAVRQGREMAGLGMLLLDRCRRAARECGCTRAIHALMHESNASRNAGAPIDTVPLRRYTLYAARLAPPATP